MSLIDLFEKHLKEAQSNKVVAFFPGRFQPMHKGHKEVFNDLKSKYGDAYILTSNDTSSYKSPFSFADKRLIMTRLCDIPGDKVVETKSPYSIPVGLGLDEYNTVVLMAVSEKDMQEDARFQFPADGSPAMKKDGTPKYIQKFPGSIEECEPMATHAYIIEVDVNRFTVAGENVTSASEIRELLIGDEETAKAAFQDLYDTFDQEMFDLMRERIEAKVLTVESIILEGGNVWKGDEATKRIAKADVEPTVRWLEKITGMQLMGNLLGSTGIKADSGDLDIGVSQGFNKDELRALLDRWAAANDPFAKTAKTGSSVHFRTPIKGDPKNGYVQTDFMFLPDLPFARWSMAAPESKYRARDRAVLMSSIAKTLGMRYSVTNGLTDRETGKLVEGGKDGDAIAKHLLGDSATKEDLSTVESILAALKNDPNREAKLADARETLAKDNIQL